MEDFYIFIKRTLFVKFSYLLIAFFVGLKFLYIPKFIFATIFLMIVYAIVIFFIVKRHADRPAVVTNTLFLLSLLDVLLLTVIINFLGLTLYIIYSFYIIIGFMSLPRRKSLYLLGWISILYLGMAILQYFQIFRSIVTFPAAEITLHSLSYVSVMASIYFITLLFFSIRCYDFYKVIEKRIRDLQGVQIALVEEKNSIKIRVRARARELEEEKESLEKRILGRRKDLEKENEGLEERIEELERFKKVALGREMKAQELEERLLKIGKRKNIKK